MFDNKLYEVNLPTYLQKDIDALKEAVEQNKELSLDLYYYEVYGSINSALYSNEITIDQAEYLRDKYYYHYFDWD